MGQRPRIVARTVPVTIGTGRIGVAKLTVYAVATEHRGG